MMLPIWYYSLFFFSWSEPIHVCLGWNTNAWLTQTVTKDIWEQWTFLHICEWIDTTDNIFYGIDSIYNKLQYLPICTMRVSRLCSDLTGQWFSVVNWIKPFKNVFDSEKPLEETKRTFILDNGQEDFFSCCYLIIFSLYINRNTLFV